MSSLRWVSRPRRSPAPPLVSVLRFLACQCVVLALPGAVAIVPTGVAAIGASGGAAGRLWLCAVMELLTVATGLGAALSSDTGLVVACAFAAALCEFVALPSAFGVAMELMPPHRGHGVRRHDGVGSAGPGRGGARSSARCAELRELPRAVGVSLRTLEN